MSDRLIADMADRAVEALLMRCHTMVIVDGLGASTSFGSEVATEVARRAKDFSEMMGLVDGVRPIMGPSVDLDMTVDEREYILEEMIMGYHILKLAFFNLIQHSAEAVAGGEKQREKLAALLRQIRSRIDSGEFD